MASAFRFALLDEQQTTNRPVGADSAADLTKARTVRVSDWSPIALQASGQQARAQVSLE